MNKPHPTKVWRQTLVACAALFGMAHLGAETMSEAYTYEPNEIEFDIEQVRKEQRDVYRIRINPFVAQKYHDIALASGYPPAAEPDAIKSSRDLHQPAIRYIADLLESKYGIDVVRLYSWSALEIDAIVSKELIDKISRDEAVVEIGLTNAHDLEGPGFVSSQAAGDTWAGNEIVPWYRGAVNVNDLAWNGQNVYMIDYALDNPGLVGELSVAYRFNLNSTSINTGLRYHATHVAGVIGASANNALTRGVSPSQLIYSFGLKAGFNVADFDSLIDEAVRKAEVQNHHPALSISYNSAVGLENLFAYNKSTGKKLRVASNRSLVVESAGNNDRSACDVSFGYPSNTHRNNDGILVVGASTRTGARMTGGFNPVSGINAPVEASNYGACVEVWAPGHEITSPSPDGGTRVATGTSFAAPIVAALATRVGNANTRPIIREQYIKNHRVNTGRFDPSGLPIMKAWHVGESGLASLPQHLPIVAAYSATNMANIGSLYDGKYTDMAYGFWNAMGNWGSVVVDLGAVRTVKGVRLTLRSSGSNQPVGFQVFGGTTSMYTGFTHAVDFVEPYQEDLAPIYIPVPNRAARYLYIAGNNNASWLAYSEIEVYGN